MATWGAHIRIAEAILENYNNLDARSFLIGNVGPDCGEPNEDWSEFSPPKTVSHWLNSENSIDSESFFNKYLSKPISDMNEYSFLLGYYSHLITDKEWGKMFQKKVDSDPIYAELETDKKFIWKIKEDWYDLDHLYFMKNPTGIFHKVFKNINSFPDYLDYYPVGAIERQIKYISNFYTEYSGNPNREYTYLTETEMDSFVKSTSDHIVNELHR